jgi:hypothetical protein
LKFALASYRYPGCPNARHPGHPALAGELTFLSWHLGHPPNCVLPNCLIFGQYNPSIFWTFRHGPPAFVID